MGMYKIKFAKYQ